MHTFSEKTGRVKPFQSALLTVSAFRSSVFRPSSGIMRHLVCVGYRQIRGDGAPGSILRCQGAGRRDRVMFLREKASRAVSSVASETPAAFDHTPVPEETGM